MNKKFHLKFLSLITLFLNLIIFLEANSNSCFYIYQEKKPKNIDSFKRFL